MAPKKRTTCLYRPDRLAAAIEASGRSPRELARLGGIDCSHQRIDQMTRATPPARTDRTNLAALARALHIPLAWLTGEIDRLPVPYYRVSPLPLGARVKDGRWAPIHIPARGQLAVVRFTSKCLRAAHRDLKEDSATESDLARAWARVAPAMILRASEMVEPAWPALFRLEADRIEVDDLAAQDDAIVMMVAAAERCLDPWFRGVARVNYDTLGRWRSGPDLRDHPKADSPTTLISLAGETRHPKD